KDYLYVEAVAFDPSGSGRKDYVAYIGLKYNATTPSNSYIMVWVQNTVTGAVSNDRSYQSDRASWFDDNQNMYQHEAGNFFAITAGDYSGDGKDTIVAYLANNGLDYGLVELEYDATTNVLDLKGSKTQDMLHQKYVTEAYFGQEMAKTEKRQNKLSCDLATGDFNGDGIDDLAVLSYINRVERHSANADWDELDCAYYCPWLRVAYGQENGHEGVLDNDKTEFTKLWKKFLTYDDGTKFYLSMIAPGLATGDTDGDGKDEIIVAGYENTIQSKKDSVNSNDCDTPFNIKKNKIIIASFDAENRLGEIGADNDITRFNEVDANGWLSGTSTSLFTNDPVWQPMGVECVAFNGHANKELAFIGGTIYDVDGEPSEKYTPNYFTQNDAGVGSVTINTGFIPSVAVGNFDGNTYGYEQIIFLVGLKENLYHDYFYLRGFIGREYDKDTGELKVEGNKDVYYSNGDSSSGSNHISNTLIIDNKGDNFSQVLNCVLVPIDRDHDGAMVRYVGVDYAYSDPQVMAVLQAAPWFGELGDDYGATTYTFTQEYEYTVGKSDSVSFGAGGVLSLEGTIGGIDIKAGYVMDWTESFEDTLIRSTSDSFTAKAYDSVVVYRTPVYIYKYETFNPEINDWHGDGISISVPKMPTYIQMSVSDYNAFADAYNQLGQEKAGGKPFKAMKKLDLDWLGKEGNPWGYSNSLTTVSNAAYRLGYNGGETSSTSADGTAQTETISQAHGFTFEMTATFGFDACFVSSKAGFYGSLDYMNEKSESTTTSSTTETSGTVQDLDDMALLRDGIPESVTRAYGFTWELGKTTRDLGVAGENALILGYRVTDITAPAPPVIDLEADLSGETAVELTWNEPDTAGRLPVNGYNVYQKDGKNYTSLNDELLGADERSFDVSGLKSNT
ncbi:MAG: fibronectin type III domain-containing protein, partial [Clostridiales bacterium]|nr:fibronectin type III domain-containing protein [Clostridiales bacterium]